MSSKAKKVRVDFSLAKKRAISFALGDTQHSHTVKNEHVSSIGSLAKLLSAHPSDLDGGPYICASPMKGGVRNKENTQPTRVLIIDFDHLAAKAEGEMRSALQKLDVSHLIYETRRSTADAPRIRLIVVMERAVTPEDYPRAHASFIRDLERAAGTSFDVDSSSAKSEQPQFTPVLGREVRVRVGNDYVPVLAVEEEKLQVGSRNVDLTSIAGSLRRFGCTPAQIEVSLSAINQSLDQPLPHREIVAIARSIGTKPVNLRHDIVLRQALDLVKNPIPALWLVRPFLEENVLAVMTGSFGTFKSFLALCWSLHIAAGKPWWGDPREKIAPKPVVFISAEGRGLAKRILGWVKYFYPDRDPEEILAGLQFYAIEAAVNLSEPDRIAALRRAIDEKCKNPALIVVDTLSRNSRAVEESNSEMQTFLNGINDELRMNYGCSVLLIHHTGHTAQDRPRGPSSLVANTEASYLLGRQAPSMIVEVETQRLKDTGVPEPLELQAHIVDLDTIDEDGKRLSTLVLVPTGNSSGPRRPEAGHKLTLLEALEKDAVDHDTPSWSDKDIGRIGKGAGLNPKRVSESKLKLHAEGFLQEHDGRWQLVLVPSVSVLVRSE